LPSFLTIPWVAVGTYPVTCILEALDNFEEIVSAAHKVIKEFDCSTEHTTGLKARFEEEKRVRTLAKRLRFDGRN